MTLPAIVDAEDAIPAGFEEHYRPTDDGRFVLDAEGVEDVAGLKSALDKERAARKALKAELAARPAPGTAAADDPQGRARLERRLVEAEAAAAVLAARGIPELLLPILLPRLAVEEADGAFEVRVVDEHGVPRRDSDGGAATIGDLLEEFRASDIYGRAFEGSGKSGSGAPSTAGAGGETAIALSDPDAVGRHLADIATGRMRVTT